MNIAEKIPLKITISGKRACGKTMLIAKLKQFFEMQGCQIKIVSESDDPKYYPRAIKDNQNKKCYWDKWDITIEEENAYKAVPFLAEEYEQMFETARKYLKIWNNKKDRL